MREKENIKEVLELSPHYLGFIFHRDSPRYVDKSPRDVLPHLFPQDTKKVGVFVNAPVFEVCRIARAYHLDFIQLHGTEPPEYASYIRTQGFGVIKVFALGDTSFDFHRLKPYLPYVSYFLFDTQGKAPGGNGVRFNWTLLKAYPYETPFFLSGGIGPEHLEELKTLKLQQLYGIDVNSKFEQAAGVKEVKKLKAFSLALYKTTCKTDQSYGYTD